MIDSVEGRLLIGSVVLILAVFAVLYLAGIIPEFAAGLALATLVVVGCCTYGVWTLLEACRTRVAKLAAVSIGLAVFGVSLGAVVGTLHPGRPLAAQLLATPGDTIALPNGTHGWVRLLLRGKPAGTPSRVEVVFGAGGERARGHLSRTDRQVRAGRRGSRVVLAHTAEYLDLQVDPNVDTIELERLRGKLDGPLSVEVYRGWTPFTMNLLADALLLVIAALAAARLGATGGSVAGLSAAMIFALVVYTTGTPELAVRPEIGGLMLAVVGGAIGGNLIAWGARKVAGRPRPVRGRSGRIRDGDLSPSA